VRADAIQADRSDTVRKAARSWRKAGAIDEPTLAAIAAAYPDDRARVGPVFRILLFVFTIVAVNGAFGFGMLLVDGFTGGGRAFATLAFAYGLLLAALTEWQTGSRRRRQGGTEAGTSFAALGYLIASTAWIVFEGLELHGPPAFAGLLLVAALLLAGAAWRWGYCLYAGAAAAAVLGVAATLPGGRLLWIALPALTAPLLAQLADAQRLPPAHRASWAAVLAVALTGLYVAVHLGSFDSRLIEELRDLDPSGVERTLLQNHLLRSLSAAATAIVPLVYLGIGIRTRRYPFLLVGLGTAVASLVTLRYYVHLAPLWVVLAASGAALILLVLALRRYLDSGVEKERGGFTAEPLFEDAGRRRLLEAGAAVVSLSPEARNLREEPRFTGGGGEFGGGGASSDF
jgi:MFS family permease